MDLRYHASSEVRGDASNGKIEWYHPLSNMIEVFGNTRGYSVSSGGLTGGSLITQISKTFEQYVKNHHDNNNKSKIFAKKTFHQLFNPIKRSLHNNQFGNQVVKIEETLIGMDVFISPKTKTK